MWNCVGESRWRQWNSTPQRKGRPFGDVNASTTPDNGWRPSPTSTPRRSGGRADEQQLLAEREAELRALRSTMERNEAAILRAMEDQRQAWEGEVAVERESWERRLLDAERQTDDVRVTLTGRIRDLERQNAALQSANVEQSRGHGNARPRRAVNGDDHGGSERPCDEAPDRRRGSKQSSVNGVDGRPRNFAPASTARTASVRPAADQHRPAPDGDGPSTRCQHCEAMSGELERVREEFDAERQQWLAEKRRVIAYQKLLQSKYVQLQRHCAQLESSTATNGLNHVETADSVTPPSSDAGSHTSHGCWNSAQSSPSLLLPKLVSFGQSIET